MKKILAAWIGDADLYASKNTDISKPGPIAQALKWGSFDVVELLTNRSTQNFQSWLEQCFPGVLVSIQQADVFHSDLEGIYNAADRLIVKIIQKYGQDSELTYHLSPGTPIMAGAWMLLANTTRPATLIESSTGNINKVSIPFEIKTTYIRTMDESIGKIISSTASKFSEIIHVSDVMKNTIADAAQIASHNIHVLLEGDSGTGKELFARAIHSSSDRADKPIISVNCGAISEGLVESELFGYRGGSFTGSNRKDQPGKFVAAEGGTLFLDEIGELPPNSQVKLLRAIDTQKITMVGDTKEININVRIIAATNRDLKKEVAEKRFRLDLFYRLAVGYLKIPALKEREGDLKLLIHYFFKEVNKLQSKKYEISPNAMKILINHSWPGNVRELKNTISRCCYKANGNIISEEDVCNSIFNMALPLDDNILSREFYEGFSIHDLNDEVTRHYLIKALDRTGGNKARAAKLLGLERVNFGQWLKKYSISN